MLIDSLPVSDRVKADAKAVYALIAEAESKVHGRPVTEIHFHEVGTMDAVADVVGVCLLMEQLAPEQVIASPVHTGSGHVHCAHGILPVPAPATALILEGIPSYSAGVKGELCTPTGAALLKHFVSRFGDRPVMSVSAVGYGMGKKDFDRANCLRAFLGESEGEREQITKLECNLDDMTGEDIGFATDLVWRRTAELANRLKTKFPDVRVSQMSYIPYARIPTNDIPDNVDVFVARRGPWAERTTIGAREKGEVTAWHAKLGRKVSLWNYPDKVGCWNLEMKDIPQIAPRAWASYYRAVAPHVTGAFAESESDRWIYNYLNYYVFSRICWNPDADVEAILAEHHRLMFGAAAKEMAEFFDTLEKCWMKVVAKPYDTPLGPGVCEAPTEEEMRGKIYSPEVLARLKSFVSSASSKVAEGSIEARRIALFTREYLEPLCRR